MLLVLPRLCVARYQACLARARAVILVPHKDYTILTFLDSAYNFFVLCWKL